MSGWHLGLQGWLRAWMALLCHRRPQGSAALSEIQLSNPLKSSSLSTAYIKEDMYDVKLSHLRLRFHCAEEIPSCSSSHSLRPLCITFTTRTKPWEAVPTKMLPKRCTIHLAKLKCEGLIVIFPSVCYWIKLTFQDTLILIFMSTSTLTST